MATLTQQSSMRQQTQSQSVSAPETVGNNNHTGRQCVHNYGTISQGSTRKLTFGLKPVIVFLTLPDFFFV